MKSILSGRYEEWFHNQLLPNVQPNSLIVIHNASYHSRRIERVPTMSSRKSETQDWLEAHNTTFSERALKQWLLRLSNLPKYVIDELAKHLDTKLYISLHTTVNQTP